jgi:hypothetical protein
MAVVVRYRVRQHIPNFVTGGDPPREVEVEAGDIANPDKAPWMAGFRHHDFVEFVTEPYYDDAVLVSARYANGKSWVCSVASPILADDLVDEHGEVRELTLEDFKGMRPTIEVDPGIVAAVEEWRRELAEKGSETMAQTRAAFKDERIMQVKRMTQMVMGVVRASTGASGPEAKRRAAIALTNYEQAALWAIQAFEAEDALEGDDGGATGPVNRATSPAGYSPSEGMQGAAAADRNEKTSETGDANP